MIGIFSFIPLSSKFNFVHFQYIKNFMKKEKKLIYISLLKDKEKCDKVTYEKIGIECLAIDYSKEDVKGFIKHVRNKLSENNFEKIVMIHGPWFQKTIKSFDNDLQKLLSINKFNKYMSGEELRKDIFMMTVNKTLPIEYYCVDPLEIDISKSRHFQNKPIKKFCFYEYPDSDGKDKFHYSDLYIDTSKRHIKKRNKYKFYFSANLVQRLSLVKELSEKSDFFSNIVDRDKYIVNVYTTSTEKKNKRHSYEDYINYLENSKYTLVIPSNAINHFSYLRFIEAVLRGCIPLVYYKCNIDIIKKSHKKLYDFILKEGLIIENGDDLYNKVEKYKHSKLIEDILKVI